MITPEINLEGWIEHTPGPCPVPGHTRPAVKLADGQVYPLYIMRADSWSDSRWTGKRGPNQRGRLPFKIVAYIPEPVEVIDV